MLCVLEGGEGCLSLCQPVSAPLYKAQWTDRVSYGSDALVTAVALKYTVVAEFALPDSQRYSLSPSPLFSTPDLLPLVEKLKASDLLSADMSVFSSSMPFVDDGLYFMSSWGHLSCHWTRRLTVGVATASSDCCNLQLQQRFQCSLHTDVSITVK